MSRLIAFGCSNTYGQGLHDCYLKGGPGPHPSKYAWPAQLAGMLDLECVNNGIPGASNRLIWHNAVNFDYLPDDIIVINWSLIHRYAVLYEIDGYTNLGLWDGQEKDISEPWKKCITAIDDDYDRIIESCTFIDHADRFLKGKVKKLLHVVFNGAEFPFIPDWCGFEFALSAGPYNVNFPLALDNNHTGPRGHKELAKAIKEHLE